MDMVAVRGEVSLKYHVAWWDVAMAEQGSRLGPIRMCDVDSDAIQHLNAKKLVPMDFELRGRRDSDHRLPQVLEQVQEPSWLATRFIPAKPFVPIITPPTRQPGPRTFAK